MNSSRLIMSLVGLIIVEGAIAIIDKLFNMPPRYKSPKKLPSADVFERWGERAKRRSSLFFRMWPEFLCLTLMFLIWEGFEEPLELTQIVGTLFVCSLVSAVAYIVYAVYRTRQQH